MYRATYLFLLPALAAMTLLNARAQEAGDEPAISTDRPGQATTPSIVRPGDIQIEAGFIIQGDKPDDISSITTLRYPATLIRIGILPMVELRLTGEYLDESIHDSSDALTARRSGITASAIGTKVAIAPEEGARPEIGFLVQLGLPVGDEALRPRFVAPMLVLALRNAIGERFNLYYNVSGSWNGIDAAATGGYAGLLSAALASDLSGFVELYGTFAPLSTPLHALDAGFSCVISPDFQIDLFGGIGLTENAPDYFMSGGISLRFP